MYHTLEFLGDFTIDLQISPRQPLERMVVHKGSRLVAQLRPYVVEAEGGPVEVADLFFEDGSSSIAVRFECFSFVDQ
jgi:hypothetical protein